MTRRRRIRPEKGGFNDLVGLLYGHPVGVFLLERHGRHEFPAKCQDPVPARFGPEPFDPPWHGRHPHQDALDEEAGGEGRPQGEGQEAREGVVRHQVIRRCPGISFRRPHGRQGSFREFGVCLRDVPALLRQGVEIERGGA